MNTILSVTSPLILSPSSLVSLLLDRYDHYWLLPPSAVIVGVSYSPSLSPGGAVRGDRWGRRVPASCVARAAELQRQDPGSKEAARGGLTPARSCTLHGDWARPCHICAETWLTPATSAPGLGSPLPHLRRDWAHPCHICAGIGLAHSKQESAVEHH
jgi:hypothetical protein